MRCPCACCFLEWLCTVGEVDDPSAVVAKNNQSVKKPKCRGGDDEHVERGHIAHVVAQEAAPGRGGDLGCQGMYLPTMAWLTSIPSMSSSP